MLTACLRPCYVYTHCNITWNTNTRVISTQQSNEKFKKTWIPQSLVYRLRRCFRNFIHSVLEINLDSGGNRRKNGRCRKGAWQCQMNLPLRASVPTSETPPISFLIKRSPQLPNPASLTMRLYHHWKSNKFLRSVSWK